MPQGYSKDPYTILGLPTTATASQVKEAYRRLARQYHPDLNQDPHAAERMKDINWANGILGDPHERSRYDLWRSAGVRVDPAPRPNPMPPNAAAPFNRNDPWREVKKARPIGWSATAILWLVLILVRTLSQANQPSYVTNPSSFANAQTLDAILQESLYVPMTMTAMVYSSVSPYEQTQEELLEEYSIPTDATPSLTLIDIRDQVTPGSQVWEWINTLLAEYQLTTPRGLSNEVTRVRRDLSTGELVIETRQYGSFRIYMNNMQTPASVRFPLTMTVPATPSSQLNDFPTTVSNPSHIDIRARVVPGTQEWEWINTYLSEYHLTTPDGLSDEVTGVYYSQLTEEIVIETRQYGVFSILTDPRLGGFSVVHHPPTPTP